jgi:hypothetical protein
MASITLSWSTNASCWPTLVIGAQKGPTPGLGIGK